jgi:CrcB protein
MSPSLATIGLVALCGGVGSVVRLLVATGVRNAAGEPYLLGTLVVNLIGCFLFGVAWGYASGNWSKAMQAAVFTGFFGGFTTFSSFAFESYELFVQGRIGLALGNIAVQNVLGVLGAWFGIVIGRDLA